MQYPTITGDHIQSLCSPPSLFSALEGELLGRSPVERYGGVLLSRGAAAAADIHPSSAVCHRGDRRRFKRWAVNPLRMKAHRLMAVPRVAVATHIKRPDAVGFVSGVNDQANPHRRGGAGWRTE